MWVRICTNFYEGNICWLNFFGYHQRINRALKPYNHLFHARSGSLWIDLPFGTNISSKGGICGSELHSSVKNIRFSFTWWKGQQLLPMRRLVVNVPTRFSTCLKWSCQLAWSYQWFKPDFASRQTGPLCHCSIQSQCVYFCWTMGINTLQQQHQANCYWTNP